MANSVDAIEITKKAPESRPQALKTCTAHVIASAWTPMWNCDKQEERLPSKGLPVQRPTLAWTK